MDLDVAQVNVVIDTLKTQLTGFGLKLIGALLLWFVGGWLIKTGIGLLSRVLKRQSIDPTLIKYLTNFLGVTLQIVLIVAILGYFGIETTSFAALLAAGGDCRWCRLEWLTGPFCRWGLFGDLPSL